MKIHILQKIFKIIILFILLSLLICLLLGSVAFKWIVCLIAILVIKYIEGLFIYQIKVNKDEKSVTFRTSFGKETIKYNDVKEWGFDYNTWHSWLTSFEGNTTVNLKVITQRYSFTYPIKVMNYYLFTLNQEELISEIWGKHPKQFLNTKDNYLFRILKTSWWGLGFLWI